MDFFEKNLNERFKDASSLKGVDPDDLWNQIESEVSEKPSNRFPFYFWKNKYFLSLAFLVLIGALIGYQLYDNSTLSNTKIEISKNQIENIEKTENNSEPTNSETIKHAAVKTKSHQPNIKNEEVKTPNNTFTKIQSYKNSNPSNEKISEKINFDSDNLTTDSKINNGKVIYCNTITNQDTEEKIIQNNNLNKKENTPPKQLEVNKIDTPSPTVDIEQLTPSPIISKKFIQEITGRGVAENINDVIFPAGDSPIPKLKFGAFAGIHTIKNIFSTNLLADEKRKDLLNKGYEYELGQSYSLEVSYRIHKDVYFKSGIEFLKSKSEFNIVQTWDTIIVNPNSPVGVLTNAEAKRTVLHHNKMKSLSVPLIIALQKSIEDFEIGLGVGVGLNFTSSQIGKSLNSDNIIALYPTNENEALPISDFFLSYQLQPFLNYRIHKNTSIQFRADIRYQSFGDSDFFGLKYSSIFMGGGIGVEYKF